MDELNQIIADNIYTLRKKAGMTQSELADRLNYTDKLISKWERGESVPNTYTMKTLSEIFSVSLDELYGDHRADHMTGENAEKDADGDPGKDAGCEAESEAEKREINRQVLTAVIISAIALAALVVFVVLWIVLKKPLYEIFIYAMPAMLTTLLIFNSVWNKGKHNFMIIGALVATVILTVYTALLHVDNFLQLFFLLFPAELFVWLTSLIKRKADRQRKSRLEKAVQIIRKKSGLLSKIESNPPENK